MASTINASTSPAAIVQTADGTGILALQTGNTTAVTIDASQNVGIGVTPSPANLPTVENAYGLFSGQQQMNLATNAYYNSGFKYQGTGYATRYYVDRAGGQHIWWTAPSGTAGNAITFTQAMTLDSSGNLLLGLTSQQSSGKFCINFDGTVYNGQVLNETSGASGSIAYTYFMRSGTIKGSITYASATNLVSYSTTSDYRLKENIVPLPNALNKVMQLKPSQYTWKENGYTTTGFIAHELAEVMPDAVTGEKDAVNEDGSINPQGIDTSFLVATLTAAIQEQQALITSLTARITALEGA